MIKKTMAKWTHSIKKMLYRKVDERLIDKLISERSDEGTAIAIRKHLLQNQASSLNHSGVRQKLFDENFATQMTLANCVIDHILGLGALVGIQPLQGPVGLTYRLQFNQTDQGLALEVVSNAVEAVTRKLQARFTLEAVQDLQTCHRIDFKQEVMRVIAEEIGDEITHEVLTNILALSESTPISISADDSRDRRMALLFCEINKVASFIAHQTRRGAGNIIVMSPILFETLVHATTTTSVRFEANTVPSDTKLKKAGYLGVGTSRQYTIYTHPSVDNGNADGIHTILVGYKGSSGECDAGYIYSPYVPMMSNVAVCPHTFSPQMSIMTRYGKHVADNAEMYYRAIDLNIADIL